MKHRAKKALSTIKVEVHRTGGGPVIQQLTALEEKVVTMLGNRAVPLVNPFDSDALYSNDLGICNYSSINVFILRKLTVFFFTKSQCKSILWCRQAEAYSTWSLDVARL